jgi:hypothetical protein
VGKARQGCGDIVSQNWSIGTRKVVWTPKAWEIRLDKCWTEIEATAAVYGLNKGGEVADLTNTNYMSIVVEVLSRAIREFIVRLAWFNDLDAENYIPANGQTPAGGGAITPGVDTGYFNILDGLWKQLLIQVAANPAQRVVIAENAGSTYASQELSPDNVKTYLQQLKFKAPITLRSKSDAFIACTQSVYDAWDMHLQGKALESTYTNLVNGQKTLAFNGIPMIPMPVWDKIIGTCEDTGTKLNSPHRALFATKDILAVGVDGEDSFEKMNIWYEKKDRKNYIELMGKADAKLLNPAQFQLAI